MGGLLSRSAANNRALDGLRASMCIWMILFHSHFWQNYFIPRSEMLALGELPLMQGFVLPGYMAVDVFFVLTGYLLSTSLFKKHQAARAKASKDGDESVRAFSKALVPVNIKSWVYRRSMRVLPGIIAAGILWCLVLFREGMLFANGKPRRALTWSPICRHVPSGQSAWGANAAVD